MTEHDFELYKEVLLKMANKSDADEYPAIARLMRKEANLPLLERSTKIGLLVKEYIELNQK